MKVKTELPPELEECSDGSYSAPNSPARSERVVAAADNESSSSSSVSFAVRGLYTRKEVTEEEAWSEEPEFVLCRRRMRTKPLGSNKHENDDDEGNHYDKAWFEPEIGLVGTKFWHEYDSEARVLREDRAILFQSQENYQHLHEEFGYCFEDFEYMENPTFGEQVIVNGCETSELCVGDVFVVEGSTLVVEITSPRKPCSYINLKHDTVMGSKGIQSYAHHQYNGTSGWFARVLSAGELREGMTFTRTTHPHPKWTLPYVYKALYGEGSRLDALMNKATWHRSRDELEELMALPQLAEYEWKVEVRKQLLKLDGIDWKTVRHDSIDPHFDWEKWILVHPEEAFKKAPGSFQFWCIADLLQTITEALKFFLPTYNTPEIRA
jgi:MOSC domain-containing protein YiiM